MLVMTRSAGQLSVAAVPQLFLVVLGGRTATSHIEPAGPNGESEPGSPADTRGGRRLDSARQEARPDRRPEGSGCER